MYSSISFEPTVSPGLVPYLLTHTRIDNYYDTDYVAGLATVATEMVESYLSRFLFTKTATWTVAHTETHGLAGQHYVYLMPWPWTTFIGRPVVPLPRPCTAINSVVMGIWGESPVTLVLDDGSGTGDYDVDTTALVGRIRWISNTFENSLKNYLQINFTGGYGSTVNEMPLSIRHAIALIVTNLFENRGDADFRIWTPAVEALLAPHRITYFG